MTGSLLPLLLGVGAIGVGLVLARAIEAAQYRSSLVGLDLRFPNQLDGQAVADFLASVTGILPPWWRRWLSRPFVVLEVRADAAGICHDQRSVAGP